MVMYKQVMSPLSQLTFKYFGFGISHPVPMTADEILAKLPEGSWDVVGPNRPEKFSAEDAEKIFMLYHKHALNNDR